MTKYFRNVLAAQYRGQIDFKKMQLQRVSMDEFLNGNLSEMVMNKLYGDKKNEKDISIIFVVKTIKTQFEEGMKVKDDLEEQMGVFYVPAKITNKDGEKGLEHTLKEKKLPWIPRELLEPPAEAGLSFGYSRDSDKYFEDTTAERNQIESWKDYISYCKNYFYAVTKTSIKWKEDYKRNIKYEDEVYVFQDHRIDTVKQIIELYDDIAKSNIPRNLYEKFIQFEKESLQKSIQADSISSMQKHCGQMGGEYPLSKSQRRVVNCFNNMTDGEILAVSGPPGTGKTTLLQSIVADLFVKAALDEAAPPVIVATSANNQAVTNIIQSFGKINAVGNGNLENRWVDPNIVKSFAVYFPSKNKMQASSEHYHITSSGSRWNYFVKDIDNEENIEKSSTSMLKETCKYYDKDFINVSECKEHIHNHLSNIEIKRTDIFLTIRNLQGELNGQPLEKVILDIENEINEKKARSIAFIFHKKRVEEERLYERYIKILSLLKKIADDISSLKELGCDIYQEDKMEWTKGDDIYKLNELIDVKVRYIEFWLAVHYFECRYLEGEYKTSDKQKACNYEDIYTRIYHRLALLTPCMVMTFYSLPNNFKVYNKNKNQSTYLYNFTDLLIIDEAGQATPEVAAASFALAKKALVVGDEEQIPPVPNVEEQIDIGIAEECKVIENKDEYSDLQESGHNCAVTNDIVTSVMKVAKNSCRFSDSDKDRGLFLSEHRRCYDEIIAYCNELVYGGRLEACRGSRANDKKNKMKFPVMGHYDIPSGKAGKGPDGNSRINKAEANKIVDWIKHNYDYIFGCYPEVVDKKQILAIITPFKAQAAYLKRRLGEELGKDNDIDVGTVHTFQGAERKVIILSTVYGENDQCSFINDNESLMNVAVSRAKDAFWVFGAYDCLDKIPDTASGLLRKYVKAKIDNNSY